MKKKIKIKNLNEITERNLKEITFARLSGLMIGAKVYISLGKTEGAVESGGWILLWKPKGKKIIFALLKKSEIKHYEKEN